MYSTIQEKKMGIGFISVSNRISEIFYAKTMNDLK